ncbi:retrovirus-related pol polyprotein from transposon TNT 1-94 [Tanacetum coccineum]
MTSSATAAPAILVVEIDESTPALEENPMVAQLRTYDTESLKKDKALTCLHSGTDRVKAVRLLTLKREFELLRMKDDKLVKDYSARMMDVVNQTRLHGEVVKDQKVVEKMMISVPPKFEAKISAIKESCDLDTLTVSKLNSKLQAQEQRVSIRSEEKVEGAFRVSSRSNKAGNSKQNTFKRGNFSKGNNKGSTSQNSSSTLKKGNFTPCNICQNTNHQEEDCWFKDKPNFKCNFCNKFGYLEKYCRVKKARNNTQGVHQANVSEEDQVDDEHLFMASHLDKHPDSLTWLMDSGCTSHITPERSFFISHTKDNPRVKLGDGRYTRAKERGTITINTKKGTKYISRVLYVPELDRSMLSMPQMIKNGYGVNFKNDTRCVITDSRDVKIATLDMENDSYYLKLDVADASAFSVTEDDSMKWHKRFGHFNYRTLQHMYTTKLVRDMPPISEVDSKCEGCELGKSRRLPFSKVGVTRATHKLEIVHSDVCGPMSTTSWSGNKYFVLFIDDYTRMCWVYFLSSKASVFSIFKSFKKLVEVQSGSTLRILRTDNGGEYTSNEFEYFLWQQGVIHQVTVPYSPQQNGVSERKNRTVMEMARSMLYENKLPKRFWAEAVATSVYWLNRLATKVVSDSKIVISRDVTFDEGAYWEWNMDEVKRHEDTFLNETYHDKVNIPEFDIEDTTETDVLRTRRLIGVYESCNSIIEPESYMNTSKHSEWIDAMKAELEMIKKNNTWKLVDLPKGKNAIDVKWVYKTKFQPDGSIYKHKARLVVKGYSQVVGVDFEDTFAPVARHDTIKRSSSESILYIKQFNSKERMIISLYVDDLLVIGSNNHLVKEFKKQMESEFDMSDMGLVSYFLGMEIKQLPNVTSPLVYKCKLSKDDGKKLVNPTRFRSIVGSLLYLTISRPDLAFAPSFLSRFMGEPSSSHLGAIKRVLRYVKGSLDLEIMFERNKVVKLEGYADSDWAGSIDDSKSTSGYIFTLGSGVFC